MKLIVNDKDLSGIYGTIEWAGDRRQRSRSLTASYLHPYLDGYPQAEVRNGDTAALYDDSGKLRFVGIVTKRASALNDPYVTFTARDILWYLGRNKTAGVYEGMPDEITRKVLGAFSIQPGTLPVPDPAERKTVVSTGNRTIHQVIQEAYGEGYYVFADGDRVSVGADGGEVVAVISGMGNLLAADYNSSIEEMVNRVLILNGDGAVTGDVRNDADLAFGLLQETYKAEEGKDPQAEARKLLKGEATASTVECLGNLECVAGKSVYIMDTSNGMLGKFVITDDKHTFSGGIHRMRLGVEVQKL